MNYSQRNQQQPPDARSGFGIRMYDLGAAEVAAQEGQGCSAGPRDTVFIFNVFGDMDNCQPGGGGGQDRGGEGEMSESTSEGCLLSMAILGSRKYFH